MMYSEGTGKAIAAILLAVTVAVAAAFWQTTQFVLRFVWDLVVINLHAFIESFHSH